jgi:CelD/BcsL family acetyltransferase involved in cellulose biosynthesis
MLDVAVIADLPTFEALEAEWTALLSSSRSNSVTITWPWLHTWWRVYQAERQLRIVTVRDGGRLIGAAPLLARRGRCSQYRVLSFRRIELLASGEARADQICSDYLDWAAESGREQEVVAAIVECLCGELSGDWDEMWLPDVSAESPNLAYLASEAARRGLHFEILKREPCAVCSLPDTWNAFLDGLGSGLRYKIRRGLKEFDRLGGSYTVVASADELPEASDTLMQLHQQRWTAKGRPGAFHSERRRRFHQLLMPLALERGWLRLGVLRINGEPLGAIYNFRYAGKIAFYQSGIVTTENNHLRPGLLMHALEIRSAIEAGCHEYDFLKRGHSDYKDAWTTAARDLLLVRVARPGLREAALRTFRTAHDGLRSLKHRFVDPAPAYGASPAVPDAARMEPQAEAHS